MKKVIIADSCCLCYGANNAIQKTIEALKSGRKVAMLHEILHNKNVMNKLACMGARVIEDVNEVHTGECVIICAHGEGKATFDFLQNSSIEYLDCTCPNVKAIEDLVKLKNGEGYKIIIIGKHGFDGKKIHAEVKGTMGWCDNPLLIEDESEIKNINLDVTEIEQISSFSYFADKPFPGYTMKSVTSFASIPRDSAFSRIALASGCSDFFSSAAAYRSSSAPILCPCSTGSTKSFLISRPTTRTKPFTTPSSYTQKFCRSGRYSSIL